jgi:hypothetical protein
MTVYLLTYFLPTSIDVLSLNSSAIISVQVLLTYSADCPNVT